MKILQYFISINILLLSTLHLNAQIIQNVCKVSKQIAPKQSEKNYFRFKAGDKLLFYILEQNDENISEITIRNYDGYALFQDYLVYQTDSIYIDIAENSVLELYIGNDYDSTALEVNYFIQRISKDSSLFSPQVRWAEKIDTLFYEEEIKKMKADTSFELVCKRIEQVKANNFINKKNPRQVIKVELPKNTREIAYWIGVGQEGQEQFKETVKNVTGGLAKVSMLVPDYGPLLALFFNGTQFFTLPSAGENVEYYFMRDQKQANTFLNNKKFSFFEKGNSVVSYAKIKGTSWPQMYVGLYNDNALMDIDVQVQVLCMKINYTGIKENKKKFKIEKKRVPVF